jgi:DNA (cytosine-5)-methyltransferase 1
MLNFNDQSRPPPLIYGCVCSGLSAPTLAALKIGWKAKFFSEIEKFPRAVLAHHYPRIPLHGDFTTIQKDTYGTVDALIGGTPCQDFSVAGKRLGLDAPRGNLALEYGSLARRLDAEWLVFENVPGLLSSGKPKGEDFATFISALTGYEYRPPATGWQNAGIAEGRPDRWGIVWRVLDAQYFGVAQRRRRLFVIGYRGDWRPAAAVLLEPESMRGDTPPSREKKKDVAPTLAARTNGGGGLGTDFDLDGGLRLAGTLEAAGGRTGGSGINPSRLVPHGFGGGNCSGPIEVAACLTAKGVRQDFEVETFIAHSLRGEGFDASEDGTGRGTPLIPVAFRTAGDGCVFEEGQTTAPLTTATDPCANILAFSSKDDGRDAANDISPTLRSMNHNASHANGGGQVAIAYPILEPGSRTGVSTTDPRAGIGIGRDGDPMFTLQAGKTHGIAVSLRGRDGGATAELSGEVMPAIRASQGGGDKPHLLTPSAVRRLTPTECERLQGIPDNFTGIPWNKKPPELCPDGPRYKVIGNSMAVPVLVWIFRRLDAVRNQLYAMKKAA